MMPLNPIRPGVALLVLAYAWAGVAVMWVYW
jgi:hypothetical protein